MQNTTKSNIICWKEGRARRTFLAKQRKKLAKMSMQKCKGEKEVAPIERARWLLEGSHDFVRNPDAAVALLEELVKDRNTEAMWMLGVCCEFGMGTEKDVDRTEQLYKNAAQKGNAAAKALAGKLVNWNGRGCTRMDLSCEPFALQLPAQGNNS